MGPARRPLAVDVPPPGRSAAHGRPDTAPGGPVVLHQTLSMPQEDARAVEERVSAELALRTGL